MIIIIPILYHLMIKIKDFSLFFVFFFFFLLFWKFYLNLMSTPFIFFLLWKFCRSIADMGAYVQLLEYNNIEGMILLSELSRRRIRSIQKLIRVGRHEVVVVLRVDEEKGNHHHEEEEEDGSPLLFLFLFISFGGRFSPASWPFLLILPFLLLILQLLLLQLLILFYSSCFW